MLRVRCWEECCDQHEKPERILLGEDVERMLCDNEMLGKML